MALIGTLRNKMGTWVIVFIFVALAAFTLSDLLSSSSYLFGENTDVAEIGGHSITQEEYQSVLQEQEAQFQMRTNRSPTENDNTVIQQQAWELLVSNNAIKPEYDKVGLQVTPEEVEDMIWGKNITNDILSVPGFQNESGEFDKNKVIQYLQYLNAEPPGGQASYQWQEERVRWEFFQKDLGPARLRVKYENLIIKTAYITSAEAEREYHAQNDVAEAKYVSVPYHVIPDSSVTVTNADYEKYYNTNKERFKTEHNIDFEYVVFPVLASESDSAEVRDEMQKIADNFKLTTNDSLFCLTNSGSDPNAYARYTPNTLPPFIPQDSLVEGKVFGPFLDGGNYTVVKISNIPKNDTIYTAKASHILIGWNDTTAIGKLEARLKAESLLKEIQDGADFASKARQESIDTQSGQNGGDLGWFETYRMVKPFRDAVMSATKTGLINHIVESEFGYHIINITGTKDNTGYWIGILQSEIRPSDETIHSVQVKADLFQSGLSGVEAFNKKAEEEGLNVLTDNATVSERRVGSYNARQTIQWLFREAEIGEVSPVFDINYEQFIVAVKKTEIEKGYSPLSKVKEDITPAVKSELKGKQLVEKLAGLSGTLEEIASSFGSDANVYSNANVKLSSTPLASLGNDPVILGTIFSLGNNERSKPTAGDNGVAVIELQSKTIAPSVADYSLYKNQLQQSTANRMTYRIAEVIKEKSNIVDMRYKYH